MVDTDDILSDYLNNELKIQAEGFGITAQALKASAKPIIWKQQLGEQSSVDNFNHYLNHFVKDTLKARYKRGDIAYSSGVFAFKAGCDLLTIISIVDVYAAMNMFKDSEKFDCFESRNSTNINDYLDNLAKDIIKS